MFFGILIGLVLGVLLSVYFLATFVSNWPKGMESMAVGFGIGTALIVVGWAASALVKLADKQSQKVKSGAGE